MALGKRKREHQGLWISSADLPRSPGHAFYGALNRLFAESRFDEQVEAICAEFYAASGRPSIPPGVYFRMLFVGYFEGLDSQRGIAWRCSDSLSLREFLGLELTERVPDHSSLTVIRKRLPLELHERVFALVISIAREKGLLRGKTIAVDSTLLEANAAMRTIVRKENGEDWRGYITRLAKEEAGIENPTSKELKTFDKNRPGKKVSNEEWTSPSDPDSRIMKMKDGRTHLAYKTEHAVDLETDLVITASVHAGNRPDTESLIETVIQVEDQLGRAGGEGTVEEVVADSGYHKAEVLDVLRDAEIRTYVCEQSRVGRRRWTDKPEGFREAVYANRRRQRAERARRLHRRRREYVERSFAHVCETGGARRTWIRGLVEVGKRYLMQVAARNLGLILRKIFGIGSARGLQGVAAALLWLYIALIDAALRLLDRPEPIVAR